MHMFFLLFASSFLVSCHIKLDLESESTSPCWSGDNAGPVDHTLELDDSCQRWEIKVGEHAYINVHVESENTQCQSKLAAHLTIPYDPTYSNLGGDGPKWTYDILAVVEGEGQAVIECQDGTVWEGYFIVTETSR